MNLCFFCYTPYHVFNAINVKYSLFPNDNADLFLYNSVHGGTYMLYDNLKEIGLFENVEFINNLRWQHYSYLKKLFHIPERLFHLSNKKKLKNASKNYNIITQANKVYDIVWSYGSEMEMYMLLGVSLRTNPNTMFMCYEEGEGNYRLPCTNALKNQEIDFLKNQLDISMPETPDKMLFYLPSCVSPVVTSPIDRMPKVTKRLYNEVYSQIWKCSNLTLKYDIFFMAFGDYDQSFTFSVYDKLNSYKNIRVTIKSHPRFTEPFNGVDIELLQCGTTPWEIVCGSIDDLDSKLLIGVYSTSLITAKSIYEKEPYIIFLNNMDTLKKSQQISEEQKEFQKKFIQTYSNQSKLFFPKTMDELIECVDIWREATHRI